MAPILITKTPLIYRKQRREECGVYVLKTVLDLYGKAETLAPRDLLSPIAKQLLGFTNPWHIVKALRKHGLQAAFKQARPRREQPLMVLRHHLERDEPVIILVGNPYGSKRRYYHFKRWFAMHWILLLGMDETQQVVYLYDPLVHPDRHEQLPRGNISLSYKKFLKQWRGAFLTSIINYAYIPVSQPREDQLSH